MHFLLSLSLSRARALCKTDSENSLLSKSSKHNVKQYNIKRIHITSAVTADWQMFCWNHWQIVSVFWDDALPNRFWTHALPVTWALVYSRRHPVQFTSLLDPKHPKTNRSNAVKSQTDRFCHCQTLFSQNLLGYTWTKPAHAQSEPGRQSAADTHARSEHCWVNIFTKHRLQI